MKTSLVIMAAGIGSRFGGGIKQLEPVGPNGEIIMDYSIHDAIEAGFNKVVFIIRHDIEDAFEEAIGRRIKNICSDLGVEVAYAFQEKDNLPDGIDPVEDRTKPWGTGQAVLSISGIVNEPFVVINADDYYGKSAFKSIHEFLTSEHADSELCMAGFILKNTLSENGGVTRGICKMDSDSFLTDVVETKNIIKTSNGCSANDTEIDVESLVSMNMWGLTPEFINLLKDGFVEFFNKHTEDILTAEYLLPIYIDELLHKGTVSVKVLSTPDKWFGVTYKEDKELVVNSFKELITSGVYKEKLFS
ncbi:MAG: sugar phosphate nucleotidyltransferase [Lachnospiraceae bacterium]|nr:sugar phosphate nucleotidyltransferase [Lachnospiraceae bacterium]